jgi:methylglutaconyl-CoA hydratase
VARETHYDTLEIEARDGIGYVWLNRPQVRNAFNDDTIAELTRAFTAMAGDSAVRVVVLGGRGSAFSAGGDLNWMKKMAGYSFDENFADARALADMLHTIATLPKPTVARVHGAAYAGGMGLVAACDIAVAAHEAEFCLSEVKLGLVPATISPYVLAAMGRRAAQRYFLTAERFSAAEAHRIGFVHALAPADAIDAAVAAVCRELLSGGPDAHAATKDLIRHVAGAPLTTELRAETARRIAAARATGEGKEGVRAFLEKRRPAWLPGKKKP